jgi:rSAM/selenodomain-associated transferase 1
MPSDTLLMIFIKNPELGKVKTRLAKSIGHEKALNVYHLLLDHTLKITSTIKTDKAVFYSDYINENDIWREGEFKKLLQKGEDLGEKMSNAFIDAFKMGYKRVVIIGSDCFELNEGILNNAFKILEENEVVIGPANDGGYYLLGLQKYHKQFFENKTWSTENVLLETLHDLSNLSLSFKLLPALSDIDEEKDLNNYPTILNNQNKCSKTF